MKWSCSENRFTKPGGLRVPVDTTVDGLPAIQTVVLQKFNGKGYTNVDVVG